MQIVSREKHQIRVSIFIPVNKLVSQGVYSMRLKRIVAFVLSFLIAFNVQAPMFAETEVNEDGPQLHTTN